VLAFTDPSFDAADRPWRAAPAPAVVLELHPYVEADRRPSAATYRRRRVVASLLLALAVAGLVLGARQVAGTPGGDPAPASGGSPAAPVVHVVQPGETVWAVARVIQPEGDLRPLVDALVSANGGSAALAVGQRLVLPSHG
jgi:hypothetical protein